VEKIIGIVGVVVLAAMLALAMVVFAGCANRPVVVATDYAIVGAARSADRLAEVSERIGDALGWAVGEVERIRELAGGAAGGILRALELLDEYDEFVSELVRRIMELDRLVDGGTGEEANP